MANVEYECPCCGGSLKFDPKSQKIKCEFCDSEFSIEDVQKFNEDTIKKEDKKEVEWENTPEAMFSDEEMKGLGVYHCESCGGEIVCEENVASTSCPYCGNHIVFTGKLKNELKPDYVIPFKNESKDIKPALDAYLKKKIFLPRNFISSNRIDEIKGLYVPFWLHSATCSGKVSYRAEIENTYRSGDEEITETKHYELIRGGNIKYKNLPVDGSKKIDNKVTESIEPFDSTGAVEFNQAYLAGHLAEKYDVNKDDVLPRATERMVSQTISEFRSTCNGYSLVTPKDNNLILEDTDVKYALYPMWVCGTKYEGNDYIFAMNGQTNKIVANLPCSKGRVAMFTCLFFLPIFILFLILGIVTEGSIFPFLLMGLIFGAIPAAIFDVVNIKKLKDIKLQNNACNYCVANSMNITYKRDNYLYTTRSVRKISKN